MCRAYVQDLDAQGPAVRALGGDIFSITSQDEEKAKVAAERTGASHTILSDYNKDYANSYGLLVLPQEKGVEWHHKDSTMSQPAVFVLNESAEICYSWISRTPGPMGRPNPAELVAALKEVVAEHGTNFSQADFNQFLQN